MADRGLLAALLGIAPTYALLGYAFHASGAPRGAAALPGWLVAAVIAAGVFAAAVGIHALIRVRVPGGLRALALLALLAPLVTLAWLAATGADARRAVSAIRLGALIDAGSSGSRVAVFEWRMAGDGTPHVWPVAVVESDDAAQCRLARIADEGAVCKCLQQLTARARADAMAFLGEPRLPRMPLWAKATAGVRSLSRTDQGKALAATDACLARSAEYEWRGAEVIPGEMEALYAWLAVNYLAGTLRTSAVESTIGIVELGGRSAQIAYRVSGPAPAALERGKVVPVRLASGPLHVFAMSDLLGRQAAAQRLGRQVQEACGLEGNPRACVEAIDRFLCPSLSRPAAAARCPDRRPTVDVPASMLFVGLSNFAHAVHNMGLETEALDKLRERAMAICGGPESARPRGLLRKYVTEPAGKYRPGVCFDALYAAELAGWAWDVPLARIRPPAPGRGGDPTWPLGAMIYMLADAAQST